ncbi:MAG: hypothetical protein ACK5QT_08270, partial [Oligoflexia bacterium]
MLPDREDIGIITQFIVFAIALDLGGGVVANATRSTNDWYCSGPLWLRFVFLALHLTQPVLMALTVNLPWMTVGYLYLYQLCAGSVVIANRGSGFHPSMKTWLPDFSAQLSPLNPIREGYPQKGALGRFFGRRLFPINWLIC